MADIERVKSAGINTIKGMDKLSRLISVGDQRVRCNAPVRSIKQSVSLPFG